MTDEKKEKHLRRIRELESLYSEAWTAVLRLQIIEEVEEIKADFIRHRLEVPGFNPTSP